MKDIVTTLLIIILVAAVRAATDHYIATSHFPFALLNGTMIITARSKTKYV